MSKERTFRFAVENEAGEHSEVWRIWTYGNDCYFGARGTVDQHKISFHKSGECSSGLTQKVRETLVGDPRWSGKSRHYDIWEVETSLPDMEYIKLFQLIIPNSQLDRFDIKNKKKINWFNCEENKAAAFSIFKANINENDIVEFDEEYTHEIARLSLENGHYLLVSFSLIPEKKEYIDIIQNTLRHIYERHNNQNEKAYGSFNFNAERPEIRVHTYYKQDGMRYCFEGSLRKNLYFLQHLHNSSN